MLTEAVQQQLAFIRGENVEALLPCRMKKFVDIPNQEKKNVVILLKRIGIPKLKKI